jgi:hypothetical protein
MSEKTFIIVTPEMYNRMFSDESGVQIKSDKELINQFIDDEVKISKLLRYSVMLNIVSIIVIVVLIL